MDKVSTEVQRGVQFCTIKLAGQFSRETPGIFDYRNKYYFSKSNYY